MELAEYRRMAAVETAHWWYPQTRALLGQELGPYLLEGGRFLDAGAGTGATGAWMAEHGSLQAADMEVSALELYRDAHRASGFVVADVRRLPYGDASFDAVLCVTVLCHRSIPDPFDAVLELVRVTRPGGVVCLLEPGVRRLRRAHDRVTFTGRRFSVRDLSGLLSRAGCDVLRATGAYSFLVPPAAVKSVIERGRSASDLDSNLDGLRGVLGAAARAERAVLRRTSLPFGLSALTIGRVKGQGLAAASRPLG